MHPLMGMYPADARRRELSSSWELYHQASKLFPEDLARSSLSAPREVTADRLGFARIRLRESMIDELSAAAPLRSSRFVGKPMSPLPTAIDPLAKSLAAAIGQRRSPDRFGRGRVSREAVATLLRLCAGATHTHPRDYPLRATPASGALYEIEIYLAIRRVGDLEPGLYHYHAASHSLTRLREAQIHDEIAGATVIRELVESAALQFFFTSVIGRLEWKYAQRAYRYTLLNAGHMAEHVCLGAAATGLASVPYGGFVDDPTAEALGVDGVTELLVHSVLVGRRPETSRAQRPRSAREASKVPRLRRLECLDVPLPEPLRSWPLLEDRVVAALRELEGGDFVRGREALLRCCALLPADRTLAEYCALAEDPRAGFEVTDAAIFAFPAAWGPATRGKWRSTVSRAAIRVRRWLGVEAIPRALFDLRVTSPAPQTLNRARPLHRKVLFPSEFRDSPPLDLVAHELMHAAYLPDNRLLAEGIAVSAILDGDEIADLNRELREASGPPPVFAWLFSRPPAADDASLQAVGASFVTHVVDVFGQAALFGFANGLLYPATAAERRAAPDRFAQIFGAPAEAVIQRWWQSLC